MMNCFLQILGFALVNERDSSGIYGGILHYSIVFALVGGALLAFLYFWNKGRLDMDEGPKIQMMSDDEGD